MKKVVAVLSILLVSISLFTACSLSDDLTDKADIIKLFNDNKDSIVSAVDGGSFDEVEKIRGIESVYESDNYIDFSCGGFFYSATDDLTAWNGGVCPADELYEFGDGYKYQQADGDNEYYVEEIGEHFFTMRRVFEKL